MAGRNSPNTPGYSLDRTRTSTRLPGLNCSFGTVRLIQMPAAARPAVPGGAVKSRGVRLATALKVVKERHLRIAVQDADSNARFGGMAWSRRSRSATGADHRPDHQGAALALAAQEPVLGRLVDEAVGENRVAVRRHVHSVILSGCRFVDADAKPYGLAVLAWAEHEVKVARVDNGSSLPGRPHGQRAVAVLPCLLRIVGRLPQTAGV